MSGILLMDELAKKDTPMHRIHPLAHLIVALAYIGVTASFGKYELTALLPLVFYPVAVFAYSDLPVGELLRRMLPALPFVLFIGIFNPIFDQHAFLLPSGVAISAGWLSLLSLVLRGAFAVLAALLLVSVAGMEGICAALSLVRVPRVIVMQLLFTYRYIYVLGDEASRMWLAYRLRAPGQRGIAFRQWGSFAGQWLLRSLARAERIHQAMLCRGFRGEIHTGKAHALRLTDVLYILGWVLFFAAARAWNLPALLGSLFV